MRTSFYIASHPENHVEVRSLADFLQSRGWRWAMGNAWARKRTLDSSWVAKDMHAALSADVFIFLLKREPTPGAYAQLGARWAARRLIFGIRQGMSHHPLHDLPEINWFETAEDFAQATFGP